MSDKHSVATSVQGATAISILGTDIVMLLAKMSLKKPHFTNALETEFSARGIFSRPSDEATLRVLEALRLRFEESNYRKSEALSMGEGQDRLQLLKSLFARGSIQEAQVILAELQSVVRGDVDLEMELQLQECRLYSYWGNWKKTILSCSDLERNPALPVLSRMTLLQIRANAFFEESAFEKSAQDLKKLESLAILFPHSPVNYYVGANETKILTRTESLASSKDRLQALWSQWKASLPTKNLDPLLTLLRLEVDHLRALKLDHYEPAFAAFQVARHLGDDLYAGICFSELFHSISNQVPQDWISKLSKYVSEHPRVQKLEEQITSGIDACATAHSIRAWKCEQFKVSSLSRQPCVLADQLLMLKSQILIDFKGSQARSVSLQPRTIEILKILSRGPVSKEELFLEIWKIKSFSKERHDSAIRTALKRIRAQSGIEVISSDQELAVSKSALILDL